MTEQQVAERVDNVPAVKSETQAVMAMIERVALNPDADINKLEKMLDMQERILNRNARELFSAAMAEMQADMPEVVERGQIKVNDVVRSRYSTFEDINAAVRPVLQKHGFAITFRVKQSDGQIKVTAVLSHKSGHSEDTDIILPSDTSGSKNAVQAVGSAVSYGKRYTMSALLNIATRGEDDDAEGAVKIKKVTAFQASTIRQMAGKAPEKTKAWLTENYGKAEDVPADDYNWIIETLREAGNGDS